MRPASGRDLIGGPIFWTAAGLTLAGLIAALLFRTGRAWIGLGVLVMWTGFSLANAVRSRPLWMTRPGVCGAYHRSISASMACVGATIRSAPANPAATSLRLPTAGARVLTTSARR